MQRAGNLGDLDALSGPNTRPTPLAEARQRRVLQALQDFFGGFQRHLRQLGQARTGDLVLGLLQGCQDHQRIFHGLRRTQVIKAGQTCSGALQRQDQTQAQHQSDKQQHDQRPQGGQARHLGQPKRHGIDQAPGQRLANHHSQANSARQQQQTSQKDQGRRRSQINRHAQEARLTGSLPRRHELDIEQRQQDQRCGQDEQGPQPSQAVPANAAMGGLAQDEDQRIAPGQPANQGQYDDAGHQETSRHQRLDPTIKGAHQRVPTDLAHQQVLVVVPPGLQVQQAQALGAHRLIAQEQQTHHREGRRSQKARRQA